MNNRQQSGVPFYFLDGSLKGQTLMGDFRNYFYGEVVYKKASYAVRVNHNDSSYQVYCDVAFCGDSFDLLPVEAMENLVIQPITASAADLELQPDDRQMILKNLLEVPISGEITRTVDFGKNRN